jgi:vacuolar-type H+-ATPase subunit H
VDDKSIDELEFHQETVTTDANSPLHLIREKEMEISGRVLAAKNEAEEVVTRARRQGVEITQKAEEEGKALAAEQEKTVLAEVDREVDEIRSGAEGEIEELGGMISDRADRAVAFVVDAVKDV